MNFSDEEYVRLYTTDTVTWDMLPWQALALLPLALRKFDRSGVFEFGKHGAERALSTKTKLPVDVVAEGLKAILAEEIWQIDGAKLYWPTYIEAQNCRRSERIRKRNERARKASGLEPEERDECHDSQPVRDTSHTASTESQSVTPGQAGRGSRQGEARNSDLGSAEPEEPVAATPREKPRHIRNLERSFAVPLPAANELFKAYQTESGKFGAIYDHKARELFEHLVDEGVSSDDVTLIVRGAKLDTWARDTAKLSASALLGSSEQRLKFTALARDPPRPKGVRAPRQPNGGGFGAEFCAAAAGGKRS
jgi:hypothetical protein